MWVKIRASEAERAEWHAKARSAGLTLSDLVRRSVGRVRTWTAPAAEVERERTRQVARISNNLNQIRPLGQHLRLGSRGRRGRRPPGRHRAGAHGAGPRRAPRPRCTLSSWLAAPDRPRAAADYLLGARSGGHNGAAARGRGGPPGGSPSGGRGGRRAGVRQVHLGRNCLGWHRPCSMPVPLIPARHWPTSTIQT